MPSLNYSQTLLKMAQAYFGGGAQFKVMMVRGTYAPDKDAHDFRNDVEAHEAVGAGYAPGGVAVTVSSIAYNTVTDKVEVTFAPVNFPASTIPARYAVIYKVIGSSATDELVSCVDNTTGAEVASNNSNFAVTFTSPYTLNNA